MAAESRPLPLTRDTSSRRPRHHESATIPQTNTRRPIDRETPSAPAPDSCSSRPRPTGLEVFDIAASRSWLTATGRSSSTTPSPPRSPRPLELGADLVSYSATKYLGGHSDITAGFVLGSSEFVTPVWNWRKNLGSTLAPETASLLSRSLCTLSVRVRAQNETAQAIARAMDADPRVSRVLYPGLPSFPGHALAARQMSGFGGVLTIEIAGDGPEGDGPAGDSAAATRVADRLRLFALAPSPAARKASPPNR